MSLLWPNFQQWFCHDHSIQCFALDLAIGFAKNMCSVMSHGSFKLSLFSGNTLAATTLYPDNNFLEKKEPSLFIYLQLEHVWSKFQIENTRKRRAWGGKKNSRASLLESTYILGWNIFWAFWYLVKIWQIKSTKHLLGCSKNAVFFKIWISCFLEMFLPFWGRNTRDKN